MKKIFVLLMLCLFLFSAGNLYAQEKEVVKELKQQHNIFDELILAREAGDSYLLTRIVDLISESGGNEGRVKEILLIAEQVKPGISQQVIGVAKAKASGSASSSDTDNKNNVEISKALADVILKVSPEITSKLEAAPVAAPQNSPGAEDKPASGANQELPQPSYKREAM